MLELSQILAVVIFVAMFVALAIGRIHRFIPALIGALLTIVVVFLVVLRSPQAMFDVLNLEQLVQLKFWLPGEELIENQGINWQTIIFIGGMMIMVEGLAAAGFFRWICLFTARLVKCQVMPILISFMLVAGFLAMFIDSITVLLFMAAITIELSRLLKFDPVPVIIAMIFAANTGGSATMSGDPPNIIIGTALGYTFTDFAANTGPIAWIGMFFAVLFFYLVFRKKLRQETNPETLLPLCPVPSTAIANRRLFKIDIAIFVAVVVLLVTHAQTGLSVASIGVIAALLTLLSAPRNTAHVFKGVDWRTLLFFLGLFIAVGGLEETGVLSLLAKLIQDVSGGKIVPVVTIILWVSALASGIVDNIPFAATMVPVISHLSQTTGVPLPTLAWALALGTDIGGNATPIGASANVVGIANAEKEGYHISWGQYMKYALPATILVVALAWLWLVVVHT